MDLTNEERQMLAGQRGPAVQKAMEIVTALAEIYGADRLVPVRSVNVSGVSYKNLGDAGIEFLNEWAEKGAKVIVPTTLNPAGMDLEDWAAQGISEDFAKKQTKVIDAFTRMGIPTTCTCAPYLIGNRPKVGEHIAWGESSAVCFANSVLGARTNREGGPSALASAICGRTGNFGFHLDEKRKPTHLIDVQCELKSVADFGALGFLAGKQTAGGVALFRGIRAATEDELRALGASMAAWGNAALFHVEGITPEAIRPMQTDGLKKIVIDSLDPAYSAMDGDDKTIDLVSMGCPHASEAEIRKIAELLKRKKLKAKLWVTTARTTKLRAPDAVKIIEEAGGLVVADTCVVVAPVQAMGFKHLATNSGKMAFYAPNHCGLTVRFGTTEQCIDAAIAGRWEE